MIIYTEEFVVMYREEFVVMHTVGYLPSNIQEISPSSLMLLCGTGIVSLDPGVIGDLDQLALDSPSRSEGKELVFRGVGVCGSTRFSKRYSGMPC